MRKKKKKICSLMIATMVALNSCVLFGISSCSDDDEMPESGMYTHAKSKKVRGTNETELGIEVILPGNTRGEKTCGNAQIKYNVYWGRCDRSSFRPRFSLDVLPLGGTGSFRILHERMEDIWLINNDLTLLIKGTLQEFKVESGETTIVSETEFKIGVVAQVETEWVSIENNSSFNKPNTERCDTIWIDKIICDM